MKKYCFGTYFVIYWHRYLICKRYQALNLIHIFVLPPIQFSCLLLSAQIEKTRVTRFRSYKELRETGEQKKRAFRENIYKIGHLRFEKALSWTNLDLLLIISCCNWLCFDIYIYIYIYIHSKIQRAVLFNRLSILQDTQNKIGNLGEI